MKILHCIHIYPPEFAGGTERYVETLVQAQVELGLEPTVLAGSEVTNEH